MVRALVLSEHDLDAWAARYAAGDAPAPLPYGVDALTSRHWSLAGVAASRGRLARKVRDAAEHRSGMAVDRQVRGLRQVGRSDVVLALLESQGMLPGLLRGGRVPPYSRTPLVIWSCWLADDVRSADAEARARLLRRVRGADLVTHLSRHETEILVDLGLPEERLFPVTYGVSHEFYVADPMTERDIDLLAVGQDRGRDYATLLDAVRGTDLRLDLVCPPQNVAHLDVPDNVTLHGTVALSTYRRLLQRARVVAVPTRDLAYPTGSSVALEAASTGCAVVVTATRAMSDYFVDGVNARLVPESDAAAWREVLLSLRADPGERARLGAGARDNVATRFNAHHMWTELADVLVERGIVPAAQEDPR